MRKECKPEVARTLQCPMRAARAKEKSRIAAALFG